MQSSEVTLKQGDPDALSDAVLAAFVERDEAKETAH